MKLISVAIDRAADGVCTGPHLGIGHVLDLCIVALAGECDEGDRMLEVFVYDAECCSRGVEY